MTPESCLPCCTTPQTTNVIGSTGASSLALTTAAFVVPASGANVAVSVTDSTPFTTGLNVYVGGGNYQLAFVGGPTSVTLKHVPVSTETAVVGATVVSGSVISPGIGPVSIPLPIPDGGTGKATAALALNALINTALDAVANLTDNTTGTAGNTLAAGVGVATVAFYIPLVDIAALDLVNSYAPGYSFKVLATHFIVDKPATTAAKAATITPKINGSAIAGGVLSLTSANCTPQGTVVAGSSITAANTGNASATITLTASAVTAFVEGSGWIVLRIQNMDTADAIASLRSKINSILDALTP